MLKIRRPLGRLIFNMGIAIPGKTVFLIETAPWPRWVNSFSGDVIWCQQSRSSLFQLMAWCFDSMPFSKTNADCQLDSRNKLQWNLNENTSIFIQENVFENVTWNKAAILFMPTWVECDDFVYALNLYVCIETFECQFCPVLRPLDCPKPPSGRRSSFSRPGTAGKLFGVSQRAFGSHLVVGFQTISTTGFNHPQFFCSKS